MTLRTQGESGGDRYVEGFLAGQVVAYCEMTLRGVRLAGQMDVPSDACSSLISLVEAEGCMARVVCRDAGRAAFWIYRDARVGALIDALESTPPMPRNLAIWSMGKLFGYGDREVLDFLNSSTERAGSIDAG